MKSFRDMNPFVVGLTSMGIIGVLVAIAFAAGILRWFDDTYEIEAVFADAAGVVRDDDVRVAGVEVGRVTAVEADRDEGNVIVRMVVDKGVELGPATTAEVALATLLGTKFVRLAGPVEAPFLHEQPAAERVIPLERTRTPFDVFELTDVGTRVVEETDTEKVNRLITQLADITQGKREQVTELLEGIGRVSAALAEKDAQLRSLLEKGDRLSATLAEKDDTIAALLEQSDAVLALVSRRRADIGRGLRAANTAVGQLSGIVAGHRTDIDLILDTLHPALDILDRRQGDIDRSLAWLGAGSLGLAKSPSHGPWADIYVRAVGPDFVQILKNLAGGQP